MNFLPLASGLGVLSLSLLPPGHAAEVSSTLEDFPRQRDPIVAPASDEGEQALQRIGIPDGFQLDLVSAEPDFANPVAFAIDHQGRFFISETHRYRTSTLDIRNYMSWLEDDLAARSVEDRAEVLRRQFGDETDQLALESEIVRLLEDTDGDGRVDRSTIFADGFNSIVDGIASGVLFRDGKVWFTNIPNLWQLQDTDGDGRADVREILSTGYGVHFNLTGHDLHGLIFGPDGRLYFSIGDRGTNLQTREGRTIHLPDEGAVFRCDPDGSNLEVFARGLRNPQELAFDRYGNLFTGDNDSDQGDRERWVYVMEGSDTGWRIGYQHHPQGNAGPWNSEQLWIPRHSGQPAYLIPPVANIDNGPSGLAYNYGTGFPEEFDNCFFLCHFKGASATSGVTAYRVVPDGAFFQMESVRPFVTEALPTDVEFGPDGALYFSDWHHGWPKSGRGRIYRVSYAATRNAPEVTETRRLLAEGMNQRSTDDLLHLLGHADQRVRQEAQFELADRAPETHTPIAILAADTSAPQLARIHALWALGQITRQHGPSLIEPARSVLQDTDPELRAQAARVLGESDWLPAGESLRTALRDPHPRVRYFAALGVGRAGDPTALPDVFSLLRSNDDEDVALRHAGVMALAWIGDRNALAAAAHDESVAVRRAALLAMRRLRHPGIRTFLESNVPDLVSEAATAINDAPIDDAMPDLAAQLDRPGTLDDRVAHRAANAAFRLGDPGNARRLAGFASDVARPKGQRREALTALANWSRPPARDRIVGIYRPLPERSPEPARTALRPALSNLLLTPDEEIQTATIEAVSRLGMIDADPYLNQIVADPGQPIGARLAAFRGLESLQGPSLLAAIDRALLDPEESLRLEGIRLLTRQEGPGRAARLEGLLTRGSIREQQQAWDVVAGIGGPDADRLVSEALTRLAAGTLNPALELEVLEAARTSASDSIQARLEAWTAQQPADQPLTAFRDTLQGGDPNAGREIFFNRLDVACQRCHQVGGRGGEVGPALDGIGSRQSREYLLESIVAPNARISEGFETTMITTVTDDFHVGILKSETDSVVRLMTAQAELVEIPKGDIVERTKGMSGMPEGLHVLLSRRDLRNLVAYLEGLKL